MDDMDLEEREEVNDFIVIDECQCDDDSLISNMTDTQSEEEDENDFKVVDEYLCEDEEMDLTTPKNVTNNKREAGKVTHVSIRRQEERNNVAKFWNNHYSASQDITAVIPAMLIFQHYQTNNNTTIESQDFYTYVGLLGIKSKGKGHTKRYHTVPTSVNAIEFHKNIESVSKGKVSFNLVNIQGLITQHLDAEVLNHFQNHTIIRADRLELPENNEDIDQKQGGCMLLTSQEITLTPIESFSNGNCELIIAEAPTIKLAIALIYRPSKSNFSLRKFKEVLNKVDNYMQNNNTKESPLETVIAGDFNFPPTVVRWEKSEEGMFANATGGNTDEKIAFQLLTDITNKYEMLQMVDNPTRLNNTLDLLFTSNESIFSECSTTLLRPTSDHNLIHFDITTAINTSSTSTDENNKQPEIRKYNLKKRNQRKYHQALEATDWDVVIGNVDEIGRFSDNFA